MDTSMKELNMNEMNMVNGGTSLEGITKGALYGSLTGCLAGVAVAAVPGALIGGCAGFVVGSVAGAIVCD